MVHPLLPFRNILALLIILFFFVVISVGRGVMLLKIGVMFFFSFSLSFSCFLKNICSTLKKKARINLKGNVVRFELKTVWKEKYEAPPPYASTGVYCLFDQGESRAFFRLYGLFFVSRLVRNSNKKFYKIQDKS